MAKVYTLFYTFVFAVVCVDLNVSLENLPCQHIKSLLVIFL